MTKRTLRATFSNVLTGYNTDVTFEGRTFHVQTEDRGERNPVIDTLVYCGGQILHQVKNSYAALVEANAQESEIARQLDAQHRDLVRRARHGEFAGGLGGAIELSGNGPFDELVSSFLTTDEELTWLSLRWEPAEPAAFGGRLTVTLGDEELPAVGVEVSVRWIGVDRVPTIVATQITNDHGVIEVRWPHTPPPGTFVIFSAEAGPGGAKLRVDAASDVETSLGALPVRPSSV
ncbi:MAG: hypothetical protein U0V87_08855 [Acidobacteriota bacterium]